MRNLAPALLAVILTIMLGVNVGYGQGSPLVMTPGSTLAVQCTSGLSGTIGATAANLVCATLVPTATATLTPAATATPSGHALGWHPATTHEHGDAPPSWVTSHAQQPFTQTREGHTGYKGVLASDVGGKGVTSYLIAHILSSEAARSHGDHDYQIWTRHPSGNILASQGLLDFSSNPNQITAPIIERTTDTGERPIALAERSPSDGCETWYSRVNSLPFDLGWTICDRYQKFDGTVLGGVGAFRTMDWVIVADRLPAGHPLRANCTVEFNVCRHSFLVSNRDYWGSAPLVPVN